MQIRVQSGACVVVPIVEYKGDLAKTEFIHDPEGTLLDIKFKIRAKIYMYQEPCWHRTGLKSPSVS